MDTEWKWKTIKIGRRKVYKGTCHFCNDITWKRKDFFDKNGRVFCSKICQSKSQRTGIETNCATCNKKIRKVPSEIKRSKTGNMYCNKSCAVSNNNRLFKQAENHPNWNGNSYRKLALESYGEKCQKIFCPISLASINIPVNMLDVHHKDSNRKNNQLENLEVLCVWCHALETRKNW